MIHVAGERRLLNGVDKGWLLHHADRRCLLHNVDRGRLLHAIGRRHLLHNVDRGGLLHTVGRRDLLHIAIWDSDNVGRYPLWVARERYSLLLLTRRR